MEIFFGKEKSKCQKWYDIVKKIQRNQSNSVDSVLERSNSFGKLKGLDDDVKVISDISQLSKTMPRRPVTKEEIKEKLKENVTEIINENTNQETKDQNKEEFKQIIKEEVKEKSKKQFNFEFTEESKTRLKDSCTQYSAFTADVDCGTEPVHYRDTAVLTLQKETLEQEINTDIKEFKEAEIETILKEYKDSIMNTINVDFIDTTAAELISQKIWYLIIKGRDLDRKLKEKEEIIQRQKRNTSHFETSISSKTHETIEEIKSDLIINKQWSIESIDDKCLVYSSLSQKELIEKSHSSKIQDNSKFSTKKQQKYLIQQIINNSKFISICAILLVFYLVSLARGNLLLSNSFLCILFPLTILCALTISKTDYEGKDDSQKSSSNKFISESYKIKTKFSGQPDDLVHILANKSYRRNWDLNLIDFTKVEDRQTSPYSFTAVYETLEGVKINEEIDYSFCYNNIRIENRI